MHDTQSTRRKFRLLWIVSACVLLLLAWFLFQLFGPNPAIVVSKETTFITEPLGPDGLPDYEAYLRQLDSEGVTPENNGAVLLWQAMWPGELPEEHWVPLCQALGMDEIPSTKNSLVDPFDRAILEQLADDLAEYYAKARENKPEEQPKSEDEIDRWHKRLVDQTAYEVTGEATDRPWTSQQLPALAKWVADNQRPLDLLGAAAARPRYYSPSPSYLDEKKEMLLATLLPDIQMMRGAQRALHLRAMWHLGEGRTEAAWQDISACFRLARHASQNNTVVGHFVAIAINDITCSSAELLLHHGNLEPQLARQILEDLNQLGPASSCQRALDTGERLMHLDTVINIASGDETFASIQGVTSGFSQLDQLAIASVDWNLVLRDANQRYDAIQEAISLSSRHERQAANSRFDGNLRNNQIVSPSSFIGGVLNRTRRSELVADLIDGLLLPGLSAAFDTEDRSNARFELTRLAAALAVYRAEQGEYPEQLEELVPGIIAQLSLDLYSGKPPIYRRMDDGGYLLYSIFQNEFDDNGTDHIGLIINGQWVDEQPDDFSYEESDLVIRVPVPAFKFPPPPDEDDMSWGMGMDFGE